MLIVVDIDERHPAVSASVDPIIVLVNANVEKFVEFKRLVNA
jgi:hypothetical protein